MTVHPRALDYTQSFLSGVIPDEAELTAGQRVEPGRSYGFFTDTTLCIGCKACEVACKQWNAPPADDLGLRGTSYGDGERATTMPPFQSNWLMMSDVCKHCSPAPCLEACPTGARAIIPGAVGRPVVLMTVAPPQMLWYPRRPAFGICVQSIEHDRGARRYPHQIRCGLAKSLPDTGRSLRESGIEARTKRRDGGFGSAMKLTIQTGRERRSATCSSLRGPDLASLAGRRRDRLAGRSQLDRWSSRPDLGRHRSLNSVLFAARYPRTLRSWRPIRFVGESHRRIRFSIHPPLGVLRGA
jgi:ferredoxin